jgi:hypothetical protein
MNAILIPAALPLAAVPQAPLADAGRFTLDGDAALEARLAEVCAHVAREFRQLFRPARLQAVLLGGGYGRGEGGVLRVAGHGDRPYNDMEFYVCLHGHPRLNEKIYGHALHRLAEALSQLAGIDVEFKIISLRGLARGGVTMFSHDLVMGHRWVLGDERLLAGCARHRAASRVPLAEATRLLLNRCSGLLFAGERLELRPVAAGDADFAGRNLAKAQLALGDAVLVVHGQYHGSCRERGRRLAQLETAEEPPWLEAVRWHHAVGVKFKLHPVLTPPENAGEMRRLLAELTELARKVWLWLERRRLGCPFASASDYALSDISKSPETSPWRNLLVNAREFGPSGLLTAQAARYPRDRLFNALALLLWEPTCLEEPVLLRSMQIWLGSDAVTRPGLIAAYAQIWERFR